MYSIGLGMKLKPGAYEGYKRAHDEAWPDLLEKQRVHGVSMVIYRWGDHLFVHATAPTEEEWMAIRNGSRVEEWNTYMTQFLETDETGNIAFTRLERAFVHGGLEED